MEYLPRAVLRKSWSKPTLMVENSLLKKIKLKSNERPNKIGTALESSEGTQTSKKQKMKSSGGVWIGLGFQMLFLFPQTHPGSAK